MCICMELKLSGLKVLYRNKQFFLGGSILRVGSTAPGTLAAALTCCWTYLGISLDLSQLFA